MRTILPSVRCQIEVLELITGSSVHVRERAKLVLLTQTTTEELTASTASEATERQSGRGTVLATARALSGMCPLQRADWGFPRQVEAGLRRIGEENSRIFPPVVPPFGWSKPSLGAEVLHLPSSPAPLEGKPHRRPAWKAEVGVFVVAEPTLQPEG